MNPDASSAKNENGFLRSCLTKEKNESHKYNLNMIVKKRLT